MGKKDQNYSNGPLTSNTFTVALYNFLQSKTNKANLKHHIANCTSIQNDTPDYIFHNNKDVDAHDGVIS